MPTAILLQVGAFALGAVIGSFLNVCIHRLPREDMGVNDPRGSVCPRCGEAIRWWDNIPLVSYLLLAGRCRRCEAEIPLRYFIVELLTALIFWQIARSYGLARGAWIEAGVLAAFSAALVVVTFIDLRHRIIPDAIDKPGMALAPLLALAAPGLHPIARADEVHEVGLLLDLARVPESWLTWVQAHPRPTAFAASILGILVGVGLIWTIRAIGTWAFQKEAMGLGDVKFMGMIGGFLGWDGVLLVLLLACVSGSIVGGIVLMVTKDRHIPFGPFLSLGALVIVLWQPHVLRFILVQYPEFILRVLGTAVGYPGILT